MAEEANKTTIADLKINSFQNPVENLPDRPTMSAAALKRYFDSNSEELREAFNKLIDRLTGREGAGEIFTEAGISVEVALGDRVQWNGMGVKFIRLNADRVLETSEDGETWEATGSSGHVILDREGNALPQRSRMIFDQCEVTDDGEKTIIHGIKGENHNLLDNWYFADPINQRGNTVYNGSGYTVDRWKMFGEGATTSLTGSALKIAATSSANAELVQIMEDKSIKGKRVTLSAVVNGAVVSGGGDFPTENGAAVVFCVDENVALIARVFDTGHPAFGVWINPGKTVDIQAVKLEYGAQQTLARQENGAWVLNDAPPNKQQELAKCQYYGFPLCGNTSNLKAYFGFTWANGNYLSVPISLPSGGIRTAPAVNIESVNFAGENNNFIPSSIAANYIKGTTQIIIEFKVDDKIFEAGKTYWLSISGYITADL